MKSEWCIACPISGTTISASWRRGGKYLEPSHAYIRCSERDCQYVDLNTPPCPLSVEMVRDDSFERIKAHLTNLAGTCMCYACVAEALGVTHVQVCDTTSQLKKSTGLVVRPSQCRVCSRRRLTVMVPRDPGMAEMPDTLGAAVTSLAHGRRTLAHQDREGRVLARLPEYPVICASCVSFSADLAFSDTMSTLERLDERGLVRRRQGRCATCCREIVVFARMLGTPTSRSVCTVCRKTIGKDQSILAMPDLAHVECAMRATALPDLDSRLVVVVDSAADARLTASKLLQDAGLRVLTPETAREALELLDAASPSVYLVNLSLPDINGIRLCSAIRRLRKSTQVLAITEHGGDTAREVVLEAGVAGLLVRPVSRPMLVGAVMAVLARTAA